MEYRNLGNSGLQVSVIGLGCNNFGGRLDASGTRAVIEKCLDLGVTFFDTADIYGRGSSDAFMSSAIEPHLRGYSEEFMAAVLKPHRHEVVIATKAGMSMGQGPYWRGASRRYLMDALEASLRRLDTDYIDLYQMHSPDPRTPIEETLRALDDMVRSGKVRYIGSSSYPGWQVVEADWVAKTEHLNRFVSAQNEYSLLERDVERELLPACEKYGIGLLPFFPLASGLLTGKYRSGQPLPAGARLSAANNPEGASALGAVNFGTLEKLENFARERDHTMAELAISWLASQPCVSSVIAGATKPEQVAENARAAGWTLSADEMREVEVIMGAAAPPGG